MCMLIVSDGLHVQLTCFPQAALSLRGGVHQQEENGDRGKKNSGEAKAKRRRRRVSVVNSMEKKPCPGGPARPCALLVSCRTVRCRTAFTALRSWQAQKEFDGPEETPCELSKSIPDQQLEKTQQTPLTSVHLLCC